MAAFRQMIETYYGTDALSTLPYSFQEAVILLEDRNPDYWKRFNVSQTVIDRFTGYGRIVMQNRNNAQQLPELLKPGYGNSYWYYYIYK
ncbi:DUF6057 family protein [Parabacteroides sp. PF5-9]|uniref:DUF6057 family protein n=1 Tax=Parabacteroides sp. PF5-9 TaxID=1742404 RepID=UPI00247629B3|nr:DUF6057 family protein [Parabacteroides sp. PF5-9]MDH6356764.1 hypothetical protein [Parabacteroides sp. PF5-9]